MAWQKSTANGGSGGSPFSDDLTQVTRLAGFVIRGGQYVDGIQGIYQRCDGNLFSGTWHGGQGGSLFTINFAVDEYINNVSGYAGRYIDQITFQTNKTTYGPYGGYAQPNPGGRPWNVPYDNIGGFFGSAWQYLDNIGFFYPC